MELKEKLKRQKMAYLQSLTKYLKQALVFSWNSAICEKIEFVNSIEKYCE